MAKHYRIVRDGIHWRVESPADKPLAGEDVTWDFSRESAGMTAFLQFPSGVFEVGKDEDPTRGNAKKLSKHHAAKIDHEHPQLCLTLSDEAPSGTTYQYAVFVVDSGKGGGSGYAIGHNPPPEINVGP
jgi:hypothetical protein